MHPEPGQRIVVVSTDNVDRLSLCDGRVILEPVMNTRTVVIAANAGAWPAEGHGTTGGADRTFRLSAAYWKQALTNSCAKYLAPSLPQLLRYFKDLDRHC
jgi:hypothetical protein